ncbi:O-antigen ligase family protein [Mobilicoccus pelagius]|uniref:O-antigen ligase-related domain-containing protein n=1 Tax=Mobilicoccus pelagius NBRC 104925 TaxID=1089455 RepID=H5UV53_9MICO|nr:O-antigen ligase family protein [Mobilicoccus pelagius]GAB49611.1 hypothetical protein MOPEL_130_02180 [Mobilicoccus pelagius NBRC 104925]
MLGLWGERPHAMRAEVLTTLFVLAVAAGDLTLYPLIHLRLATVLPVGVAVVAVWWAAFRWPPRAGLRGAAVPAAMLLFAATVACSAALALRRAPDPVEGRTEVQGLLAGVAIAVTTVALSRGSWRGLTALRRGWPLALFLAVLVAAVELLTGRHLWIPSGLSWAETSRTIVAGAFRNPNDFALAVTAMISGTLSHAATLPRHRSRPLRAALHALVVAGVVVVALTESRSGLLACVLVLTVHAAVGLHRRRARVGGRSGGPPHPDPARRRHPRAIGVGLTVAACAVLAAAFLVPALAARNPVLHLATSAAEPGTARSDRLRLDLLRAALRYLRDSDGLGTGAASFEVLLARDPAPGVASRTWLHDTFLELLLQYGAPAALALAALLLLVVAALVRPPRRGRRSRLVRVEALGFVVPYLGLGCASATVLTTPIWWLLFGETAAAAWWLLGSPDEGVQPRARPDHAATGQG